MSKVSSVDWEQVKELFEAVLARPFAERDAFLDRACDGDRALRSEVESLIKSYEQAESFMEFPAVQSAAESFVGSGKRLSAGQQIAHYEILDAIGEGGMGEVYLARDTKLGRRVALKLLPQYFTSEADRLRRFRQEARAASTLSHPNVCVIHEVGETEDGRPFITMEYVEGVTLRHRMDAGSLRLGEALDIAVQIADALVAAHEAGIVHRDIKPENIMLRPDGYVKVLDFGLAKLTEKPRGFNSETATTLMRTSTPGLVMGTVAYMSPEQARGVNVDTRTDIWSLGVVLYEMVSGHAPFQGETPTDVVIAIVEKEQPLLAEFVEQLPGELERIVRKALRKDRDERYQLAKELGIDLRSLRRELQVELELGRSAAPGSVNGRTQAKALQHTNEVDGRRATTTIPLRGESAKSGRLALLILALLIIGAASFVAYKLFSRNTSVTSVRRFQRFNVTKLTTNGNTAFAAMSRDGKYVAYVMNEAGQQSLWLRQVAVDSNVRLVPSRDGQYLGIAFSPDGNYIYYGYIGSSPDERPELYRVPVLAIGATATRMSLYTGPQSASHDGKKIAFFRYDLGSQADILIVANTDGSNEQALATRKWPERFGWSWNAMPAWSSDDQKLTCALVDARTGNFVLQLVDVRVSDRTENVVPLTGQKFELLDDLSLVDSAGGVIATAKAQGASFFQLWQLSRDGSARQITSDLSDYLGLSLTSDASALVTIQRQVLSNIWQTPRTEAARDTPVTSGVGRYFDLCWTPDGKIMYASDASGSANIYEIDADGSHQKILTDAGRNYAPAVSRDGRYIVFHSNRSGSFQIWRADRDGSDPKQLTNISPECHWPQFSADGKSVVFEHFDVAGSGSLWTIPIDGGTPTKLSDSLAMKPMVSPDGKWIACWLRGKQQGGRWLLGIIPFAGGAATKVFELAPTVQISWDALLRWSADGRSVTYVHQRGGIDNLWSQPIDGGPPKQVTDFKDNRIFSFDWSRDGQLLTSRGVQTNDVILISEAK
jgi:eukaryotic-like serine/threonine-protein kinase